MRIRMSGINTVHKTLADGTVRTYHYHRATGKRLNGQPNSPEFIRSYSDAEKEPDQRLESTLIALVREYTLSVEFQHNLAPSTKAEYRRMLSSAENEFGTLPIAALEDPDKSKRFS